MTTGQEAAYQPRVYPLDAHNLTEEEIAVAFAMTSRRPEPFDEIAEQVTREKAADFHERWVLGYGHSSVAEHAVVHLAVENISRLACDTLEDNRLASYTEKSSRYQVMPPDYFHVPMELKESAELLSVYGATCRGLFAHYRTLIDGAMAHLGETLPQRARESANSYNLRLRRLATDSCRSVLPAATLTNVGVTANARVLEHAISKLMSSGLMEQRELGERLRHQARQITPTLIKYAERNPYLEAVLQRDRQMALPFATPSGQQPSGAMLVHFDPMAEEKVATALLFSQSSGGYANAWEQVLQMSREERMQLVEALVENLGDHDAILREFELVDYVFELVMDYGALREFRRHRMQSCYSQALEVAAGYKTPELVQEAGMNEEYRRAMELAEEGYRHVAKRSPQAAQYLVTHGHYQRVLAKINLRECYHLFKLRTSREAHESIRAPMLEAMRLAVEVHPQLFKWLKLRDYPDWWPFPH